VNLGVPGNGITVNFAVLRGLGSLSSTSAVTNSNGYASVTLTLTNFTSAAQLSVCVAPGNSPCQNIAGNPVAVTMLNLQAVTGEGQVVAGLAFQPLTVRVIDSSTPPNPVLGASVLFQSTVVRQVENDLTQTPNDPSATPAGTPVILSTSEILAQSDVNGLASFVPSVGSFTGPLEVEIQVSAGATAALQDGLESFPSTSGGTISAPTTSPWHGSVPARRGLSRVGGIER
jgi:hypothetical protein